MTGVMERMALVWTVVLAAGAVLLLAFGLAAWDQPVLEAVRAGAGEAWRDTAKAFSFYGDFPWLAGVALLGLALTLRLWRREWARIITAMLLAGVLAGLVSNVIKLGAGRVRPRVEKIEHGWYGPVHEGRWVTLRTSYQSFPSSHAACAFGFFFPLFLSRRLLGAAGLLLAASVAWSRVQLNAHHISDVAAGALLGLLAGWLMWRWIVARGGLSRWLSDART